MDIKVLKQAKNRKEVEIQNANRLMTSFLGDIQLFMRDKSLPALPLNSTINKVNRIYHRFFEAVEKKQENLTQRLFIYEYRRIRNETGNSDSAEENFNKVKSDYSSSSNLC